MTAEQLLDIIAAYLEWLARPGMKPTVGFPKAAHAVRDLKAEIASLRADAELGALVRRLPFDESLTNGSRDGSYWIVEDSICGHAHGRAPEEALRSFYSQKEAE